MDDQAIQKLKGGAVWFTWIAICTFVNVAATIIHGNIRLVLGATFVEVLVALFNHFFSAIPNAKIAADFFIGAAGGGIFVILGKYAIQGKTWAFALGVALYALDTILVLVCQDWLGVAIHAWALFAMCAGLKACLALNAKPAPALTPSDVNK